MTPRADRFQVLVIAAQTHFWVLLESQQVWALRNERWFDFGVLNMISTTQMTGFASNAKSCSLLSSIEGNEGARHLLD